MEVEQAIEVQAPPEVVWPIMVDVPRWPEWTASVTGAEWIDGDAMRVGARARLRQPRLPVAEWTVTEVDDGCSFTWTSSGPGVRSTGVHRVDPLGDAMSVVTLRFRQEGPIGGLTGRLFAGMIRRYVTMEAEGLKRAAESS